MRTRGVPVTIILHNEARKELYLHHVSVLLAVISLLRHQNHGQITDKTPRKPLEWGARQNRTILSKQIFCTAFQALSQP